MALLPATPQWMPGIVAWRGETIAVVDLDAYLLLTSGQTGDRDNPAWGAGKVWTEGGRPDPFADPSNEGMLLIAKLVRDGDLALGLLVPSIEEQTTSLQSEEMAHFMDDSMDEQSDMSMIHSASTSAIDQSSSWHLSSRVAFVKDMQGSALVLDVPSLLADMVQQIEIAASYG